MTLSVNTSSSPLTVEGAQRASLGHTFIFQTADITLEESVPLPLVKSNHEERRSQKADPQELVQSGKT